MPETAGPSVRQCAWCWLVMDHTGTYSVRATRKIASATHGICPGCKAAVRAEIDRQPTGRTLLVGA